MANPMTELYAVVSDRKVNPQKDSYTCYLFEKGLDKILKKCGEECAEVIIAAKNGNEFAAYRLGKEYLKGKTVEKDAAKAAVLFTQAAKAGLPHAQYMLGKLYLGGADIAADRKLAERWLTQAANQGHAYADYLLNYREEHRNAAVMLSVTRLLHHMSRIFGDSIPPPEKPKGPLVESKLLRKQQEKKRALGIKDGGYSTQGMKMSY